MWRFSKNRNNLHFHEGFFGLFTFMKLLISFPKAYIQAIILVKIFNKNMTIFGQVCSEQMAIFGQNLGGAKRVDIC